MEVVQDILLNEKQNKQVIELYIYDLILLT